MRCVTMVEEGDHADRVMARVTADLLVRHLLAGGYVIMTKGGTVAPTTSNMPIPSRG